MGKSNMLDQINSSQDVANIPRENLPELAREMRERLIEMVYQTGGHLGSALGVVEITIALHRVFDFSKDRLVLDTGHQCYPHKLLTGRGSRFATLRQKGGLSGFPSVSESSYDHFTTGHAGNAVSSALGLRLGSDIMGEKRHVVAMVGDAAIQSGVAFEAINAAGALKKNLLVILNDNEWSIAKSVGAMAKYFSEIRTAPEFREAKKEVHRLLNSIPLVGEKVDRKVDQLADLFRQAIVPGHIFEALGVRYYGPLNGHDLPELLEILERVKKIEGVVLLHLLTQKGHGGEGADKDPQRLHGVSPKPKQVERKIEAGVVNTVPVPAKKAKSWTTAFSEIMLQAAAKDRRIVAITAGMPDGTGLRSFGESYPDRFFDVGISEQHGVAFAAGLAKEGVRPVAAIYSTFLQRAYDQAFQEVMLSGHPVIFALDRAGLVGEDGPTHNGLFDIAFLRTIPRIALIAPRDESEFRKMMTWAFAQTIPVAIRYPRANCPDPELPSRNSSIEIGIGECLRQGEDGVVFGYGVMVQNAWDAAAILEKKGISLTVVDARFAKPLDRKWFGSFLQEGRKVFTVEDHSLQGGFGSAILELNAELDAGARIHCYGIPDRFIEHASRAEQFQDLGLDAVSLAKSWEQRLISAPV